jgi:hypothetical protein
VLYSGPTKATNQPTNQPTNEPQARRNTGDKQNNPPPRGGCVSCEPLAAALLAGWSAGEYRAGGIWLRRFRRRHPSHLHLHRRRRSFPSRHHLRRRCPISRSPRRLMPEASHHQMFRFPLSHLRCQCCHPQHPQIFRCHWHPHRVYHHPWPRRNFHRLFHRLVRPHWCRHARRRPFFHPSCPRILRRWLRGTSTRGVEATAAILKPTARSPPRLGVSRAHPALSDLRPCA